MKKKIFAGLILAGFGMLINADLLAQTPWLSKDVQKVANKKQFEKEKHSNTNIQAVSLDNTWVLSKGVSRIGSADTQYAENTGNIQSTGIPPIAISKGVHQIKPKKAVKDEREDYQARPAITGAKE